MGLYKAQFISMIIMTALGVGVFVGFNMEWVTLDVNTSDFFKETGFADFRIVSESGFTEEDKDKIAGIPGVDAAALFVSVNAEVGGQDGDSVALTVTCDENVSGMYLEEGEKYDPESEDGVWLSKKYADANGIKTGDEISFTYKNLEIKGKVRGLVRSGEYLICVRDETQIMPDYNTYGFAYVSPKLYEKTLGFAYYPQINVISSLSTKDFTAAADEKLGNTALILDKDMNISYSGSSGEKEEGQTMGSVLPVLFLLIAVLTMVSTMHRLAAKEKTQIGTLKALGFKDKRILRHYTSYAFMIGIIGEAAGLLLGCGIARMIMNPSGMMGTYLDMPVWNLVVPWFVWVILVLLLVLMTFIGFLSVKQMLRGTAADALRPYTPKKVKPLLIEKTKFFHKLSFGTRWNLRDIMRHKSRTAMSLIGTAGCIILIVGSFGMKDTMNSFLDLYYNGATNYTTRIYLSEDATKEERDAVIEKYDGDYGSTVSVQIGDKAVALNIYGITHDKVRIPDENNDFVTLPDDGAYVCVRISEEFGLKAGDTFTVSPYGTDDKYTLKVAGICRGVAESIVISEKYAEKLGIPHTVDSVYTDTVKDGIETSSAIKSLQSKQQIVDSFDSFFQMMDLMVYILVFGAMLLGVVVLYNLGVMSYSERYREMATLKVVGFKDGKIGRLLIGQNLWVSIVGVLIGIPAGMGVLDYLLHELAGEYEMKMSLSPLSIILGVILTLGVSVIVSLMVARKNKKIDMVEALKGAE